MSFIIAYINLKREGYYDRQKKNYENPYYLPMALTYKPYKYYAKANNPFEYQNMIYGQLLGTKADVYKPLGFTVERDDNGVLKYLIQVPSENYAVYGDILWEWGENVGAWINVNNTYEMAYGTWLSPDVFYISTEISSKDAVATVEFTASDYDGISQGQEQFYGLDLDALNDISEMLRIKAERVTVSEIENGKARFEVDAKEGESLYVSIPHVNGWRITNNGEIIPKVYDIL